LYAVQFDLLEPMNKGNWCLYLLIIFKTLPSHIHRSGSLYLVHLGEDGGGLR
jgi:hypothetical protein